MYQPFCWTCHFSLGCIKISFGFERFEQNRVICDSIEATKTKIMSMNFDLSFHFNHENNVK